MSSYLFFLKCLILSSFKKKEKMVIYDLFNKFTYRYDASEANSFLSIIRYYKKSLQLLFSYHKVDSSNSAVVALDGTHKVLETRTKYLSGIRNEKIDFIFRDKLPNEINFFQKTRAVLQLSFLWIVLFLPFLFKKNRTKIALILLELSEIELLRYHLKGRMPKELIILSAYEKDIIMSSYFFMSKGVQTILVPSSNPLSFYYTNVICSRFAFSAPFQVKEYEKLKENWIISDMEMWPPWGSHVVAKNEKMDSIAVSVCVGFMSSAMVLRSHLGHNNATGELNSKAEIELIEMLSELKRNGKIQKLMVFLHPLEKREESNKEFAINYYKSVFGEDVLFAPFVQPSAKSFNLVSIAISGFSSTQIERLYGGYITLFAPMNKLKNYFNDERLDGISVNNKQDFLAFYEEHKYLTPTQFFKKYDLLEYRWDNYKK